MLNAHVLSCAVRAQEMDQKVMQDEKRLNADLKQQQMMLRAEATKTQVLEARKYPDGCVCECKASGCDEENHEGPVCKCPTDGKVTSLPPPFEPWPFHQPGAARERHPKGLNRQALYGPYRPQMPQMGMQMQMPALVRQQRARFQQKWVGSPQKFLPPDGDYPGGSTGIPMDGYLAYETGWANDGPFHGELAPIQEAGIADKVQRPQSLRAVPGQLRTARANMKRFAGPEKRSVGRKRQNGAVGKALLGDETFGSSFDERVPAREVDSDLFAHSKARSATLDAFDSLVR
jgi:hypothetical protein